MITPNNADIIDRDSLLKWIDEDKGDMLMKEYYKSHIESMNRITTLYQVCRRTFDQFECKYVDSVKVIGTYLTEEEAEEIAKELNDELPLTSFHNYMVTRINLEGDW